MQMIKMDNRQVDTGRPRHVLQFVYEINPSRKHPISLFQKFMQAHADHTNFEFGAKSQFVSQ